MFWKCYLLYCNITMNLASIFIFLVSSSFIFSPLHFFLLVNEKKRILFWVLNTKWAFQQDKILLNFLIATANTTFIGKTVVLNTDWFRYFFLSRNLHSCKICLFQRFFGLTKIYFIWKSTAILVFHRFVRPQWMYAIHCSILTFDPLNPLYRYNKISISKSTQILTYVCMPCKIAVTLCVVTDGVTH